MMKVCYFIQSYKIPEQIYRLVNIIKDSSPDSLIIVSHDSQGCALSEAKLQTLPNVFVLYGKGGRGDFLTVQKLLDGIGFLLENKFDFDWFINLSGQDYPIKPIKQIETELDLTEYDGFLEYSDILNSPNNWEVREGKTRYYYRYEYISQLPESIKTFLRPLKILNYIQPLFRINFAYDLAVGWKQKTLFNENFICYKGSYFCTLSRKCIDYIYKYCQTNPEILNYFKTVAVPEEMILPTILVNSQLFDLKNENKTYDDFSKTSHGHPAILGTKDLAKIFASQNNFARKFDIDHDRQVLDLIDLEIAKANKSLAI